MRWLVEVTSLGRTEKDSLYVDAETWQKALQVARTLRGETDPMSGFSIELLDEGCRAVDPVARMSYEVRQAPEDGRPAPVRPSVGPPRPAVAPMIEVPTAPAAPVAPIGAPVIDVPTQIPRRASARVRASRRAPPSRPAPR